MGVVVFMGGAHARLDCAMLVGVNWNSWHSPRGLNRWSVQKMSTLSAWLSVLVKRGQDIVKPRTVIKCQLEDIWIVAGEVGCERCNG